MRRAWCTRCREWKQVTDFSPKSRHPDGTYATVLSRCKECSAELNRLRRRRDPDWARVIDKRDWQRIKTNPEKLDHRRLLTKENSTVHRLRRGAAA